MDENMNNNAAPAPVEAAPAEVAPPAPPVDASVAAEAAPAGNYAGFGQRFMAILIDGVIFTVVGGLLSMMGEAIGIDFSWISTFLFWGYMVYFDVNRGATIGKQVMKIRVQKMDSGENLTWMDAILRETVGRILSSLVLSLGYFWMLWDPKKQTWHDKLGKSVVVKA